MSKQKTDGSILPPLQNRILLCLAQGGLQTINEVTKNIPRLRLSQVCHYKPTWLAFKSLKKKGLINEVGMKHYRGRAYPQFWLTEEGVLTAYSEKASGERLLELVKQIYPTNERLACYFDVLMKLNPAVMEIWRSSMISHIGLDLAAIVLAEAQNENREKSLKTIIETLRSYPREYEFFKKNVLEIAEGSDRLRQMI